MVAIYCSFRSLKHDYPFSRSRRVSESVSTIDIHCPIYYCEEFVPAQLVNNSQDSRSTPLAHSVFSKPPKSHNIARHRDYAGRANIAAEQRRH